VFLARNPNSRFRAAVVAEREALLSSEHRPLTPEEQQAELDAQLRAAVTTQPVDLVLEGEPVSIALHVEGDRTPRALLLRVRRQGEPEYAEIEMTLDPQGHARARLPEATVAPPGFEYTVTAVTEDGRSVEVVASLDAPSRVEVAPSTPQMAVPQNRSRVRLSSEVVSFNGLEGNDWYVITEGDFLYRVGLPALYGIRMGYGHILGKGGTVEELDERGLDPRPAGFTYGFLETEFQLSRLFGLISRLTVGLGRPDESGFNDSGLRAGFQLRLRIGPEQGTNLVIAGETIPELGQRAFLGLNWEAIEGLPMGAEVHVTDQPVNSNELAVRGVFETGLRLTEAWTLSTRVSYQGRTIDHAGFGFGLAATFDW
jgi:hypothetical protein